MSYYNQKKPACAHPLSTEVVIPSEKAAKLVG